MAECLLKLDRVSVGYKGIPLIENIDFEVTGGSYIGIIGPNGSGKTTLLRTILGLMPPLLGKVDIPNKNSFGYVMQWQHVDSLFPFTVMQVAIMARYAKIGTLKRPSRIDKEIVREALDTVGVSHLVDKEYRQLSGGQKQMLY